MTKKTNTENTEKKITKNSKKQNIDNVEKIEKVQKTIINKEYNDSYVFRVVAIALLIINAIVGIANLVSGGGDKMSIKTALQEHEASKMGGEDVYEVFEKLVSSDAYKNQQLQTFNNLLAQLEGEKGGAGQQVGSAPEQVQNKKLNESDIEKVVNGRPMEGNKNPKIVVIEYTDMECPFCAKLHQSGVMEELVKKYSDLGFTYKHFPLSFHKNAKVAAEVAEIVRVKLGNEKYFEYKNEIFKSNSLNKDVIIEAGKKVGLKQEQIEKDLNEKTYSDLVDSQMTEGSSMFGVSGTPGNVVINLETGEYELVSGAAPLQNFVSVIEKLNTK